MCRYPAREVATPKQLLHPSFPWMTKVAANRCRLVFMAVGEVPILSQKAPEILVGNAPSQEAFKAVSEAALSEIDPATDLHATADYRRNLIRVLTVRCLTEAFERAKRGG